MAIFGTEATLRIQQKVQPHPILPVVVTHSIGGMKLGQQFGVGGREHLMRCFPTDEFSGEGLIRQLVPIGGSQQ